MKDRRTTPTIVTIPDREGDEHNYVVVPHPASEAQGLYMTLLSAFAPVVAVALAEKAAGVADGEADSTQLIAAASAGLAKLTPATITALFKYTTRDGEELRKRDAYDLAYCGNAWEQVLALAEIIKANGFLPF